jgi:hypothetical protein
MVVPVRDRYIPGTVFEPSLGGSKGCCFIFIILSDAISFVRREGGGVSRPG